LRLVDAVAFTMTAAICGRDYLLCRQSRAGIRELRRRASELLRRVKAGGPRAGSRVLLNWAPWPPPCERVRGNRGADLRFAYPLHRKSDGVMRRVQRGPRAATGAVRHVHALGRRWRL